MLHISETKVLGMKNFPQIQMTSVHFSTENTAAAQTEAVTSAGLKDYGFG